MVGSEGEVEGKERKISMHTKCTIHTKKMDLKLLQHAKLCVVL